MLSAKKNRANKRHFDMSQDEDLAILDEPVFDLDLPSSDADSDADLPVAAPAKGKKAAKKAKKSAPAEADDDPFDPSDNSDSDEEALSARAWGKSRKDFYGYDESETRKPASKKEDDFDAVYTRLGLGPDSRLTLAPDTLEVDPVDVTPDQLRALVHRHAPELAGLISEFRDFHEEAISVLKPAVDAMAQSTDGPSTPSIIQVKYQILLSYLMNLGFYFHLRSSMDASYVRIQEHPVVERLLQLRQRLEKLEALEVKYAAQVKAIYAAATNTELAAPDVDDEELGSSSDEEDADSASDGAGDEDEDALLTADDLDDDLDSDGDEETGDEDDDGEAAPRGSTRRGGALRKSDFVQFDDSDSD
ncbi:hypothetical protein H696_03458 [Fonticula alba]|uniref:Sas10 C-terminal domain-containing protein n=1 Tax=Fonticula alba TaxID=691883 RepID=A0A058Z7X9_FONAL|nr:hypothetical protein H696_03458 [Fonticula alba]KCV69993.1 hypothetical protein H696_03458 [Fonticula alba]|eukprot:XP_009495599.1 hypothetical protein H696_03458 [Fonticula alba]